MSDPVNLRDPRQPESILRTLEAGVNALSQENIELRKSLSQQNSNALVSIPDPKVKLPEMFSGDPFQLRSLALLMISHSSLSASLIPILLVITVPEFCLSGVC